MPEEQNIVSDYYEGYKETQAEILAKESKRVRNSIFWIAGLLLGSTILGMLITNLPISSHIFDLILFPAIFVGLGLLAIKQPMLSIVLATVVFIGFIVLSVIQSGGFGAISGILVKAIIIYLLLAGIQSAKTAERARKELMR